MICRCQNINLQRVESSIDSELGWAVPMPLKRREIIDDCKTVLLRLDCVSLISNKRDLFPIFWDHIEKHVSACAFVINIFMLAFVQTTREMHGTLHCQRPHLFNDFPEE